MKPRLANAKTRSETGLDYVIQSLQIRTPFGVKRVKDAKPYFPGEEALLEAEYGRLAKVLAFAREDAAARDEILRVFAEIKDISHTIERSQTSVLSVVEIFEIKSLLLRMDRISTVARDAKNRLPDAYALHDTEALIRTLDPRNDRLDTFYLYEEFSERLAALRKEKRELEIAIRKEQKRQKETVKEKYGIDLTPKFACAVSKANEEQLNRTRAIPELAQEDEDYVSVTFTLRNTEETDRRLREMDDVRQRIEEEELSVREELSGKIAAHAKNLRENCGIIGRLDVAFAKAMYALARDCAIPKIARTHILEIEEGRHLQAEALLEAKGKTYCPVSLSLSEGVVCVTGANMGGKTVSLKLAGLVALLAQYAFFVPCENAVVGLSNHIRILIGDSQSIERGLSSFGGEMEELKEILDDSKERSLLLIDEIASGTNPAEGFALTKSLAEYLKTKPYISLITTHYEGVAGGPGIRNLQVVGLAGADFGRLDKEIRYANRKERIAVIAKHMDYRLREVAGENEIPKDAINIAKMLGIDAEVIENAKKYLKIGGTG